MHQYATLMHIVSTVAKRGEIVHAPGWTHPSCQPKNSRKARFWLQRTQSLHGSQDSKSQILRIADAGRRYAGSTSSGGGGTKGNATTVARAPSESVTIVSGAAASR